jgi:hypothetical protein
MTVFKRKSLNLFMFGLLLVPVISFFVGWIGNSVQAQSPLPELIEATPTELVEAFLQTNRPAVFTDADTEILTLVEASDYAYAAYRWGEGGGYLIMKRVEDDWSILGADGGALNGTDHIEAYGVPPAEAEMIWQGILADEQTD